MDEKKNLEEVKKDEIETLKNKNQNQKLTRSFDKTKYWAIGIISFMVFISLVGGLLGTFFLMRSNRQQFRKQGIIMKQMGRNRMKDGRGRSARLDQKRNMIEGKITVVADKTFTIDQNGQSKNVQISDSTRFPLDSANKVTVGDKVRVWGEQDANGVIQAMRIMVNPSANQQ
jgi:hypothetical protein